MRWELWFALAIAAVVVATWIVLLASSGFVSDFDSSGFVLKNMFRRRIRLSWDMLAKPAELFSSFLPRLLVRRSKRSLAQISGSYFILLRRSGLDDQFIASVAANLGVKEVNNLDDAFRR